MEKAYCLFHGGSYECLVCYGQRRKEKCQARVDDGEGEVIGGKDHLGPRPESCRDCQLEFTDETSTRFRYRNEQKKYSNQCNVCRSKCSHPVNADSKMVAIRGNAERRNRDFRECDAEAMKKKLTLPCTYCVISPLIVAGLDRVDNAVGYTDANTVPCCTMCNMMKGTKNVDAFHQKIAQIAKWTVESKRLAILHEQRMSEIQQGSVRRSVPFHAEDEPAMRIKLGMPCAYCGDRPLETGGGLDRVDSKLGYTDANTVACCETCNGMKRDYSKDVFYHQVTRIMTKSPSNKRSYHEMDDDSTPSSSLSSSSSSHAVQTNPTIAKRSRMAAAPVDASRAEPAARNMPAVFFNIATGAVAFVAASQKEAGEVLGMQPDTVSRKLSREDRTLVWMAPHWGCYRSSAPTVVDIDERNRFIAALSVRPGGVPTRIVKSYILVGPDNVPSIECENLDNACKTLRVSRATVLELLRSATPDAVGVTRVGPLNDRWWLEQIDRRENIVG